MKAENNKHKLSLAPDDSTLFERRLMAIAFTLTLVMLLIPANS